MALDPNKVFAPQTGGKPDEWFVLQPDFAVRDGRLAICTPPGVLVGFPMEAFVRLYLLRESGAILVERIGDLKGEVQIESPKAALSFVRLFTSPRTHYLFMPPKITPLLSKPIPRQEGRKLEVIPRERLDVGFFIGDNKKLEAYRDTPADGITNSSLFQRYYLPPAVAVALGTGFQVHRVLAVQYKLKYEPLFLIQEWVGTDGSYVLERAVPFGNDVNKGLAIRFPTYL